MNNELAADVRQGDSAAFARHMHEHGEYRPLALAALDEALKGVTTLDEVRKLAGALDEFRDADLIGDPLQHGFQE